LQADGSKKIAALEATKVYGEDAYLFLVANPQ
jgi:hypothetical protein